MVSVLVEDLPPATVELFESRARRAGAASVTEHVRHELITLARERAPIDIMWEFEEAKNADPSLDMDLEAIRKATLYARGED
jgi:hypothetical protein